MDFGATLKAAREARGLTTSQVAAQTRILVQTIEDMEKNVFKRIPAPIYGRGFVKLICECLDLDPVTMVPAFMAAFNGEPQIPDEPEPFGAGFRYAAPPPRPAAPPPSVVAPPPPVQEPPAAAPAVEEPPAAPQGAEAPAEPEPPEPAAAAEPEPPAKPAFDASLQGLELFDPSAAAPEPPAAPKPAARNNDFSRFAPPTKAERESGFSRFAPPSADDDFSRFASPMPGDDTPAISAMERFRDGFSAVSAGVLGQMKDIRRRPAFRVALLAMAALVVIALCGWGIVALFRATSGGSSPTPPEAQPVEETKPAAATEAKPDKDTKVEEATASESAPAKPSVPLKLPAFYID